jgi:hypothetical protein
MKEGKGLPRLHGRGVLTEFNVTDGEEEAVWSSRTCLLSSLFCSMTSFSKQTMFPSLGLEEAATPNRYYQTSVPKSTLCLIMKF